MNRILADHLNAVCVGDPGPIRNVIAEGPGNRYVQSSCTQGEGMLAEVVSPEYIDAGPYFFTPARVAALTALGYDAGTFGEPSHGRTYDHTQWQEAADHTTTILRNVLDLSPAEITLIPNWPTPAATGTGGQFPGSRRKLLARHHRSGIRGNNGPNSDRALPPRSKACGEPSADTPGIAAALCRHARVLLAGR